MDIRDAYYLGGAFVAYNGEHEVWPNAEFPCYINRDSVGNEYCYLTDIYTSPTAKYRIRFRPAGSTSTTALIMGGTMGSRETEYLITWTGNRRFRLSICGSYIQGPVMGTDEEDFKSTDYYLEFGNNYIKDVNTGDYVASGDTASIIPTVPLRVNLGYSRIYGCEIWDNGSKVFDGLPCVWGNGSCGLYDAIGHRFYPPTNPGRMSGYDCESIDYKDAYFTITPLSGGTLYLRSGIEYNDDGTWKTVPDGTAYENPNITVAEGQSILLRGPNANDPFLYNGNHLYNSVPFNVSGNVLSLSEGDAFTGHTASTANTYDFSYWFKNQPVVDASDLILPNEGGANYDYMFRDCTGLVYPPQTLYGSTVSCNNTYFGCTSLLIGSAINAEGVQGMSNMYRNCVSLETALPIYATNISDAGFAFGGCTSLTTPAEMPNLLSVGNNACQYMYSGCTSLERAPILNDVTAGRHAFDHMFDGCSSLNYIEVYWDDATITNGGYYINDWWVNGVASAGTFIYPCTTEWWNEAGEGTRYGYPAGWEASCREMPEHYNLIPVTYPQEGPLVGDYALYDTSTHSCVTSGLTTETGVGVVLTEGSPLGWTKELYKFGVFNFEGSGETMTMKLKGTSDYIRTKYRYDCSFDLIKDLGYSSSGETVYLTTDGVWGDVLVGLTSLDKEFIIACGKVSSTGPGGAVYYPTSPLAYQTSPNNTMRRSDECKPWSYFVLYRVESRT